jgi:hypothetical protein
MEANDFSFMNATSMARRDAWMSIRSLSHHVLLNSQSVGHYLQETPSYLAIIEQLGNVLSARFAHATPETAVLHERKEVLGDVGHAGSVLCRPRAWKHDTVAIVDPMAFPE